MDSNDPRAIAIADLKRSLQMIDFSNVTIDKVFGGLKASDEQVGKLINLLNLNVMSSHDVPDPEDIGKQIRILHMTLTILSNLDENNNGSQDIGNTIKLLEKYRNQLT